MPINGAGALNGGAEAMTTTNGLTSNGIGSNPVASTSAVTLDGPENGVEPVSSLLPSGLDREELVRLTLQCLTDAGYPCVHLMSSS